MQIPHSTSNEYGMFFFFTLPLTQTHFTVSVFDQRWNLILWTVCVRDTVPMHLEIAESTPTTTFVCDFRMTPTTSPHSSSLPHLSSLLPPPLDKYASFQPRPTPNNISDVTITTIKYRMKSLTRVRAWRASFYIWFGNNKHLQPTCFDHSSLHTHLTQQPTPPLSNRLTHPPTDTSHLISTNMIQSFLTQQLIMGFKTGVTRDCTLSISLQSRKEICVVCLWCVIAAMAGSKHWRLMSSAPKLITRCIV